MLVLIFFFSFLGMVPLAFWQQMPDHSESFPGKEEMERSLQKLSKDLKATQRDRDKALQELSRLKQHLLEKVIYFMSLFSTSESLITKHDIQETGCSNYLSFSHVCVS